MDESTTEEIRQVTTRPTRRNMYVTSYKEKMHYRPNPGYEPYWAYGEWIVKNTADYNVQHNISTTKAIMVCFEECNFMYRRIGPVCATISSGDYIRVPYACYSWWRCSGLERFVFDDYYRTFDSYCHFLAVRCKSQEYEKYGILHLGKCEKHEENPTEDVNDLLKPIDSGDVIVSRMYMYLSTHEQNYGLQILDK